MSSTRPSSSPSASLSSQANPGLVNVGNHSLYMTCRGTGSPTVILEAGLGADSSYWDEEAPVPLPPKIARYTRVCAYDRAGDGYRSGDWPSATRVSADDVANDLHALLGRASIPPPYVLVGHSMGGIFIRAFQSLFANEVVGFVFIDANVPASIENALPWMTHDGLTWLDPQASVSELKHAPPVTVPTIVVTAGTHQYLGWPIRWLHMWGRWQDELAALSPDSIHVLAPDAEHVVWFLSPDLVVEAIRLVVDSARTGKSLPSCQQVFPPVGGKCV